MQVGGSSDSHEIIKELGINVAIPVAQIARPLDCVPDSPRVRFPVPTRSRR
jgi:hypothetical protein